MSLIEMARDYRAHAAALKDRVKVLEAEADPAGVLVWRIKTLRAMAREAQDLAVLCERYYERGYRRNGRYTL